MHKQISLVAAAAFFAASVSAQCLVTAGGSPVTLTPTGFLAADDEGLSAPLPLGFNFPMAGGASATFSHVVVESNGVAYLTNGGAAVGTTTFGVVDMPGLAGDSPRIAAFWSDLEGLNGGANYAVTTDASVPGVFTINWIEVNQYFQPGTLSAQAKLFANGDVSFSYSPGIVLQGFFSATVGVSAGNGLLDVSTDLSALPTSAIGSLFEDFTTSAFDLQGGTMFFAFSGTGYTAVSTCTGAPLAYNLQYGKGCYDVLGAGVYEFHADAAIASAALQGNALQVIPTGYGYTGLWLAGGATAYLAPTGAATIINPGDDGSEIVTLPSLMPSPKGLVGQVTVSGNAIVTLGGVGNNEFDFTPTGGEFVTGDATAFYAWHDYNESEGGDVKTEQVGNLFCITFENVENYSFPLAANPSTVQFQLDLSTGACTMLWVTVDSDTTSGFGSAHLVGWKTSGVVTDNGSQVLATALPIATGENLVAMSLSASPNPISTPTIGTTVTYQTDNMPEFAPGAGIYVGINILSLSSIPAPGVDLFFIGAPGCSALIGSLDVILNMVGVTPTQSVLFPIPAGVPIGTTIWSQSASLIAPNSLPNGQNAFGLTTSNGVETFISVN